MVIRYILVCLRYHSLSVLSFFFFNDTATTEIYTLSLHDALPICSRSASANAASLNVGSASSARSYAACASAHADRKSTRLNSSHSQISYAVFCLKKKKLHSRWLRIHIRISCTLCTIGRTSDSHCY